MKHIKIIYDFFRLWILWGDRKEAWQDAKMKHNKEFQKELNEIINKTNKSAIEYISRYSSTDEYDDVGRWARVAYFKGIQIAWITKLEIDDKTLYTVNCKFPTMPNDTACESGHFDSYEGAQIFLQEKWDFFISLVKEN
jgi:hypothetical protein